jgi:hypothetical protein
MNRDAAPDGFQNCLSVLLLAACALAALYWLWPYRFFVLIAVGIYAAFIFMRWLCRYHPHWAVFITAFVAALLSGGRGGRRW